MNIIQIKKQILGIAQELMQGGQLVQANNNWGGAGVIVCFPGEETDESRIIVRSQFALEISYFIETLRDVFNDVIDFENKFEFYGRLAHSVNVALMEHDSDSNGRYLALAMLREAYEIASEIEMGRLQVMLIVTGSQSTFKGQSQHPFTAEEIEEFFRKEIETNT
ncbi:MAG: hypothetical protein O9264_08015 [Leptospira sp.]|nr:hypothetical protein [Leptospira sp.]